MKDLLSGHDARARTFFASTVKRTLSSDFWTNGVGYFFVRAS